MKSWTMKTTFYVPFPWCEKCREFDPGKMKEAYFAEDEVIETEDFYFCKNENICREAEKARKLCGKSEKEE